MKVAINLILFKVSWLTAVLTSAAGVPQIGVVAIAIAVAVHLRVSTRPLDEVRLLFLAGVVGLIWESVLVSTGWLSYTSGIWISGFAPYWIVAMWILFATTLNVSFRWLRAKPMVAFLLGGVFGPASFLAGSAAGSVNLEQPTFALAALTVGWALLFPALIFVSERFDGTTTRDVVPA